MLQAFRVYLANSRLCLVDIVAFDDRILIGISLHLIIGGEFNDN
ncbi:hypothetical protein Hjap01_04146 [Haloarcula japonica]